MLGSDHNKAVQKKLDPKVVAKDHWSEKMTEPLRHPIVDRWHDCMQSIAEYCELSLIANDTLVCCIKEDLVKLERQVVITKEHDEIMDNLHAVIDRLRGQLKYYEQELCVLDRSSMVALKDTEPVKAVALEKVIEVLEDRDAMREALEEVRTYLEERGIRKRGKVGRTRILPMIDNLIGVQEVK